MTVVPHDPASLRRYGRMLVESLQQADPNQYAQLARDPLNTVQAWPGVDVVVFEPTGGSRRDGCSVYGYYMRKRKPPKIGIARATSTGRMHFTALHELGHHLQPDHPKIAADLYRYDDEYRSLEDRICDAFAAEILTPDDIVEQTFTKGHLGPTASDVVKLFEQTRASRAACCVRAAQHLRHEGWVILADLHGVVEFAAAANHNFRLAPGTAQPGNSPISLAGRTNSAQGQMPVTYPSGKTSPHYNIDAVKDGNYVFAVLSLGATPWNPAPVPGRLRVPGGVSVICPHPACEHEWVATGDRCDRCGEFECPRCGRCSCVTAARNTLCPGCYIQRPPAEFPDGSEICVYCA